MTRRPPRSTLFPYPALSRSLCAWAPTAGASPRQVVTFEAPRELLSGSTRTATLDQISSFGVKRVRQLVYWRDLAPEPESKTRSEEHTSELQSRQYLVCRLLL